VVKRLDEKLPSSPAVTRASANGIAQGLAAEGANIVLTGRDKAKLNDAAISLGAEGTKVLTIAGDVRKKESADGTVAAAMEAFGRLDILVNNAQSSKPGIRMEDMSQEDIELTVESGLMGMVYHMPVALPHMKARGGSIVNLGSLEGILGSAGFGIYGATKEAIGGLSRTAAREWGCYNIRVNVICPAAWSPAAEQFFADHPDRRDAYLSQIALGRLGDPATDIASAAVFLASAESAYITGQTINVDGGQTML